MTRILKLTTEGPDAPPCEPGLPDPATLVAGSFATRSWNAWEGEDGRLLCGTWDCEPGTVRMSYTEWEFCHILSGRARLTAADGTVTEVGPGDGFVIVPGFEGTWETLEPLRKHYVILLPPQG